MTLVLFRTRRRDECSRLQEVRRRVRKSRQKEAAGAADAGLMQIERSEEGFRSWRESSRRMERVGALCKDEWMAEVHLGRDRKKPGTARVPTRVRPMRSYRLSGTEASLIQYSPSRDTLRVWWSPTSLGLGIVCSCVIQVRKLAMTAGFVCLLKPTWLSLMRTKLSPPFIDRVVV